MLGIFKGNKIKVDSIQFFLMIVVIFFIKVILVQWSYNRIFPILRYNATGQTNNFRPLTFTQSIIVVILFNNLFSR